MIKSLSAGLAGLAGLATLAVVATAAQAAQAAQATITVVDDLGRRVTLARPAQRVISMSPHLTELLFAAGGAGRIVGAMNFSDYPPEAKSVPLVGSDSQVDIERVVALKPDLLLVWQSGNSARQVEQLRQLGIPLFYSEPNKLDQVAGTLLRLGELLGTGAAARPAAAAFRAQVGALERQYAHRPPVRVFYQVWDQPLYTLNGNHVVSDALRVCGGVNIFGALKVAAPSVGMEAVLEQDPEAIVGGRRYDPRDAGLTIWKPYAGMLAVRRGNLFTVEDELLTRAGPRIALGAARLCAALELARGRRAQHR